jgi:hypothetical protein
MPLWIISSMPIPKAAKTATTRLRRRTEGNAEQNKPAPTVKSLCSRMQAYIGIGKPEHPGGHHDPDCISCRDDASSVPAAIFQEIHLDTVIIIFYIP